MKIKIGSKKSRKRGKWNKSEKEKYDSCLKKVETNESIIFEAYDFTQDDYERLKKEVAKYGYLMNPDKDFLGKGQFGAVFIAVNPDKPPGKFAVKAIHKDKSRYTYTKFDTTLENEIDNYKFFSEFKDKNISKHFPKVYETINNEKDEFAYIVMEMLSKNPYEEEFITFVKGGWKSVGSKQYKERRRKIMNNPSNILHQSFKTAQSLITPEKNYLAFAIMKHMEEEDLFRKIGDHISNMDFKESKEGEFKGKVDIERYIKRKLKGGLTLSKSVYQKEINRVLKYKFMGHEVHGYDSEYVRPQRASWMDGLLDTAAQSGEMAWINFFQAIIETYNMWMETNKKNILKTIVKYDIAGNDGDLYQRIDKKMKGIYWIYDAEIPGYINDPPAPLPWPRVKSYIKSQYDDEEMSNLHIAASHPDEMTGGLKWQKILDIEYYKTQTDIVKMCGVRTRREACVESPEFYIPKKIAEQFGMMLNIILQKVVNYLKKSHIPAMPDAGLPDPTEADVDLSPQTKSFIDAINTLRDKYGISAKDLHMGNLMIRASTGEIVAPDVGMFERGVPTRKEVEDFPLPSDLNLESKSKKRKTINILIERKKKRRRNERN